MQLVCVWCCWMTPPSHPVHFSLIVVDKHFHMHHVQLCFSECFFCRVGMAKPVNPSLLSTTLLRQVLPWGIVYYCIESIHLLGNQQIVHQSVLRSVPNIDSYNCHYCWVFLDIPYVPIWASQVLAYPPNPPRRAWDWQWIETGKKKKKENYEEWVHNHDVGKNEKPTWRRRWIIWGVSTMQKWEW